MINLLKINYPRNRAFKSIVRTIQFIQSWATFLNYYLISNYSYIIFNLIFFQDGNIYYFNIYQAVPFTSLPYKSISKSAF